MLVTTKKMFEKAKREGYAIVAPDFWNSTSCKAYVECAEELGVPCVLSYAQVHKDMMSIEEAFTIGKFFAEKANTQIALHLDHGQDVQTCKKAIDLGFTSVMIDASSETYEVNVARTKEVVEYAHAHGVVVEAELGHVGTGETYASDKNDSIYTEVDVAKKFVEETGVDSLAVSIGTAHGKYKGTPVIDFDRLHELNKELSIPLVLHGGSGSGENNLERCATEGITKINVFTDFTIAALDAIKGKEYEDLFKMVKDEEKGIKDKLAYYYNLFHTAKGE